MGWDSFGLPAENAAIRNDEHPATYTYANIDTQFESFRSYGVSFDWSRRFNTSDPEYYRWTQWLFLKFRERGLAYRKNSPVNWCPNDQTVLANEQVVDGALRALRRRGDQARADPVVLQDHRLRPGAAGRPGRRWRPPGPTGWSPRSATGSAAPRAPTSTSPSTGRDEPRRPVYTTRPDTLFGATFMVVAADAALAAELVHRRAAPGAGGLPGRGPQGHRHRPAGDRPAQDRRLPGRARDQPGHRRRRSRSGPPTTCWPTTAPARSWPCPARTSATGTSPGTFGLPIVRTVQPPEGWDGRGVHRRRARPSTPANDEIDLDGLGVDEAKRHDRSPGWRRKGVGTRRGQLPAARLAAVPAALLGRADPDHPLPGSTARSPVPEDQLPVELPELRGADLKPKGISPLAAADRLGQRRPARRAAARPRGTPTPWTPSWTRPGTSSATARRTTTRRPFDRRGRRSGCPATCTSAASSTRCCTCCTPGSSPRPCTTWAWSTSTSRSRR